MKYEHIRKIVEKIEDEMVCPQCNGRISRKDIRVSEIGDDFVDFLIPCEHCSARISVTADVQMLLPIFDSPREKKDRRNAPLNKVSRQHSSLSDEDVKKVRDALENFKGGDIQELFNS